MSVLGDRRRSTKILRERGERAGLLRPARRKWAGLAEEEVEKWGLPRWEENQHSVSADQMLQLAQKPRGSCMLGTAVTTAAAGPRAAGQMSESVVSRRRRGRWRWREQAGASQINPSS